MYWYEELISHLKSGDCTLNIPKYLCPNKCNSEKFSKKELKSHLEISCPLQMMRCIECKKEISVRKANLTHKPSECIKEMTSRLQNTKSDIERAQKDISDLQRAKTRD